MKKLIIISFVCMIAFNGYSQTIKVVDAADLSPVSRVVIQGSVSKTKTITDENGFVNVLIFNEKDTLLFSHVSYQEYSIAFSDIKNMKMVSLMRRIIPINEMIISANKIEESRQDVSQLTATISRQDIQMINPMSSGDLLENSGVVFVQQSQFGGSSPGLRGFEANRVLLVVDGIRLNNAVYRSGHLQNVITIDPEMLDKVEVLFGPGSVMYGSDALGGVMSFVTPSPKFSFSNQVQVSGKALMRYSSAAGEQFASTGFNIGTKNFASYTNFTWKTLGDLRQGNIHNPAYGDWGKCLYYAAFIDGKDSMMVNSNPNIQKNSGYSQTDILQKLSYKISDNSILKLNLQHSNSSNVPRYDRLSQMSGGGLTYAEWYYGPQTRTLGALSFETKAFSFADMARFTASYQNITEDRINRKFNKGSRRHQEETIDVLGFYADLSKEIKNHELRYGLEVRADNVESVAYGENIKTGEIAYNQLSRYPDDYNKMLNIAAYFSHALELNENFVAS